MLVSELETLVETTMRRRAETQTLEVKSSQLGCPKRLFDTLSSFSNQDDGGVILFGLDESHGFEAVGVYDVQQLQKHVMEQCEQMAPVVRPVFTCAVVDGRNVVAAEIPACDIADRPCFYTGKGRLKGSYVRVGDADKPMTEYEVYSYEAYRKKHQDELAVVERATFGAIDEGRLAQYLMRLTADRPNLARMDEDAVIDLMGMRRGGKPTLASVLLFSMYPQAFFPQLSIIATVLPDDEPGGVSDSGNRFLDNKRIEGTLSEQLAGALAFVRTNTRTAVRVDPATGRRVDVEDYPLEAVRELLLNALIHRDYSSYTVGMPIQLQIFPSRLVITNPGGLYGRISIDELGRVQPDTRNPVIATAMEVLRETENRYSGIPTVRRLVAEAGMPEPVFEDTRGEFRATLRRAAREADPSRKQFGRGKAEERILEYCREPRSRAEVASMLGVQPAYVSRRYINPMVEAGLLGLSLPGVPQSSKQRYHTLVS